jgi:uncharacterized membrane protein YdbT with pleckstrin-like domain
MFCNKCGAELPEGSGFCNKCGSPQGGAAAASAAPSPVAAPGRTEDPKKEEEVWSARYSARAMGLAFVGAGAWLLAAWIAYLWLTSGESKLKGKSFVLYTTLVASLAPLLYATALTLWRKISLRYRLTTQRLFVYRGFISRRIDEVEIIRVDDVSTAQNIVERIFGVGSVLVISTDATHPRLEVEGIEKPEAVKEQVRTLMKESRKRSVHFESL